MDSRVDRKLGGTYHTARRVYEPESHCRRQQADRLAIDGRNLHQPPPAPLLTRVSSPSTKEPLRRRARPRARAPTDTGFGPDPPPFRPSSPTCVGDELNGCGEIGRIDRSRQMLYAYAIAYAPRRRRFPGEPAAVRRPYPPSFLFFFSFLFTPSSLVSRPFRAALGPFKHIGLKIYL